MRHGEYVALGKVEAALKTSAAIANVVIYGSGAILMPIAIACPVEKGRFQFSYSIFYCFFSCARVGR